VVAPDLIRKRLEVRKMQSPIRWDPSKLHFEFPIPNKEARYKELVLYISQECLDDPTYSKVKQLKILFYSDFDSYGRYGTPITGMTYKKMPFGPAPAAYDRIWTEMQRDGKIRVVEQQVFDLSSHRILPLEEPDLSGLSGRDIAVVNRWIGFFWGKTAREVSEYSHGKAWTLAEDLKFIPYEAAFISDEPVTIDEIDRAKNLGKQYGWKI
jgi:hypothetical protein